MKSSWIIGCALMASHGLLAQSALQRFVGTPALESAWVGVSIVDVATKKPVVQYNSEKSFAPASTMKLLSTSAALLRFGADFRYVTPVGYSGSINKEGTLTGNVIVKGSGDPSLGSEHVNKEARAFLREWVQALKKAGIKRVEGRVVVDDRCYDYEPLPVKWTREDAGNYYAAGVYGANVFDNLYSLVFNSAEAGKAVQIVRTVPDLLSEFSFRNYLTASSRVMDSAYIYGEPYDWERTLFGTVPCNTKNFVIRGDIPDPPFYLSLALKDELVRAGVDVTGGSTSARVMEEVEKTAVPELEKEVHRHQSAPLSEIVRVTNFKSFNLFAESMIRLLAGKEHRGSYTVGCMNAEYLLRAKGVKMKGVKMSDGSGLSPFNRVTPEAMTSLLMTINASPIREVFLASLPEAGREGSVRSFLKDTPLEGNAQLKSGFYTGVLSYGGFVNKGGRQYAVYVVINNFSCSVGTARAAISRMLCDAW